MRIGIRQLIFLITIIVCSGCSMTRSLSEGEKLYRGAKVEILKADKNVKTKSLETNFQSIINSPKINKKFLGVHWKLRFHNFFYSKKQKGLRYWFQRKLGEPPVVYDEQVTQQIEKLLENRAFNNGFFNVEVSSELKEKRKKVKVKYKVHLLKPYVISSFQNAIRDSLIKSSLRKIETPSLIKLDRAYNLSELKKERERITKGLQAQGYYFFNPDYLIFKADTSLSNNSIALSLELKESVDSNFLRPQTINQIIVIPDFNVVKNDQGLKDTLVFEGIQIISKTLTMKATTLHDAIVLKPGELYSTDAHQKTLDRISFLRNYQFIDVQFKAVKESNKLDVIIKLTPRKREAIEGSIGFSLKPDLYAGPELSLSYLNRNAFKGAEQLRLTLFANYNFPLVDNIASLQEQGVELEVSKPGLIIPFNRRKWSRNLITKTTTRFKYTADKIRLPLDGTQEFLEENNLTDLLDLLRRDSSFAPFISFNSFEFNLIYQWRKRIDIQHELNPVKITLQSPNYEITELRRFLLLLSLTDASLEGLLLNLEKMLILQPSYTFYYDSRLKKLKKHNYFYRGKTALAQNKLLESDPLIPESFLESQFLQLENDIRYFWRLHPRHTIGFRFAANVSFPFKDQVVIPFFDLYSVGGPNSIRAFAPRQVGPGTVEPAADVFFLSGTGDILLESNLEWRPKLSKLLELGFFIDAGNVWLFNGGLNNNQEAVFDFDTFYQQLAIGTGWGLRFDFDLLLLRFDFAWPLTKPWLPEGERWVGDEIQLGSLSWLGKNTAFNLGFGYSF